MKSIVKIILHLSFIILIALPISYGQNETTSNLSIKDGIVTNHIIIRMQKNEKPFDLPLSVPLSYQLKVEKNLSKYADIWLLTFNDEMIDAEQMIRLLLQEPSVKLAQADHVVELRQSPNDPLYGNQWQHQNIQSELAWDITTGGTTANGHDIVVAVIESADLNHNDLVANKWVNTAEIPNNGIDDDGNGYVDDYNGWNVSSNNDNIGTGSHGTSCAGMIGAKGDNNLGVSGINWNVKIMSVAGHNSPFTESNIVAAYEYALQARLRWNQSNGEEGSFVVATSASWGVDGGNPNSYPIWCGFYEDLGEVGILNVGATTNNNWNVDQTGDVPTTCPSNYMISVTATNQNDVIDFAGYGATTIDVAAPGSSIYTTSPNNNYTTTSGTSFACPLTAGLIGLMYSVPCSNLDIMAMSDPQGTADIVRQALFDGVDQTSYLSTRTVTGGRINAKNSLEQLMLNGCSSCMPPTDVEISILDDYTTNISFNENEEAISYNIHYRVAGSNDWSTITSSNTEETLSNLLSCTTYEFYITSSCDEEESNSSALNYFTTSGCGNCIDLDYCASVASNPTVSFYISTPSSLSGTIDYTPTTNFGGNVGSSYAYGNLVLVEDGSGNYEGCGSITNGAEINGNIAVFMRGNCNFTDKVSAAQNAGATSAIVINNVNSAPIDMGGTDNSITIPAVMISQSDGNIIINTLENGNESIALLGVQKEWIQSFEVDGMLNDSGDNDGYLQSSFPNPLTQGESYDFELIPGYDAQELPEITQIWIDANQDGDFDASEIVYQGEAITGTVTGQFSIPFEAETGSTRMRVQMISDVRNPSNTNSSCGNFSTGGEIEDYCITIESGQICGMNIEVDVVQPDCSSLSNGSISLDVSGGEPDYTYQWNINSTESSVSGLPASTYKVIVTDATGCDTIITVALDYTSEIILQAEINQPSCPDLMDGSISLTSEGQYLVSYVWENDNSTNSTLNNIGVGNYTVTASNEIGCTVTETFSVTAPPIPEPLASFTMSADGLNASFNNNSSNANSYHWDFGDGGVSTDQNPTHIYTTEGDYQVCLTAVGQCSETTQCNTITVQDKDSKTIEEDAFGITLFPNPAKEFVKINVLNETVVWLKIYTPNGQLMKELKSSNETTEIITKEWESGIYLFNMYDISNHLLYSKKVTITK